MTIRKQQDGETVTGLLIQWRSGNPDALNKLLPLVYDELRKLARHKMQNEREGHTLQHTALVHEVYLKLVQMDISWNDRAHFFAMAARAMRHILVDHARTKNRDKRGGEFEKVSIDEAEADPGSPPVDILDLDRALQRLSELDSRQSEIIELHYFGGMTHEEMAAVTGVSPTTIDRELRLAKAWIKRELSDPKPHGLRKTEPNNAG
jgi:RNA polymerase sigma-70 factor, ECF subfamily